jgi:hypothetical protein
MQKITATIKTMLLAAIILVMAQGCIPTTPTEGNPTPTLVGKIKNIKNIGFIQLPFTTTFIRYNFEYKFNYDSLARVRSIDILDSMGTPLVAQVSVEWQTNKVIVKQPYDATQFVEDVYFLQPNTNLIDSIYRLENSSMIRRTLVVRNNLNNLESTNEIQYYGNIPSDTLTLDSFVYVNNNIVSLNSKRFGVGGLRKEFQYNMSLNAKTNTNASIMHVVGFPLLLISSYFPSRLDIEVLGVSLGNGSLNLISGYREIYDDTSVPFVLLPSPNVYTATQIKNGESEQNYY